MLLSHMDAKESLLVALSQVAASTGHPIHKGTPREAFVREFLDDHLASNVAIGTGELIDSNSRPRQPRRQFDIVIHKRNYPKLDFGGGISGFLIESVIATIEVKSTLTQSDIEQAIGAAREAKALTTNVTTSLVAGHVPPKVLNYVVAYAGPANMQTVYGWISGIHNNLGVAVQNLPPDPVQRTQVAAPSLDAVIVLKKGFVYFDNSPVSLLDHAKRFAQPDMKWVFSDTQSGNLLLLFLMLTMATANLEGKRLEPGPYVNRGPGIVLGLGA